MSYLVMQAIFYGIQIFYFIRNLQTHFITVHGLQFTVYGLRLTEFYNGSRLIFPWVRIVETRHALSLRSRYYAIINRQP